jgi:hypothetical protein
MYNEHCLIFVNHVDNLQESTAGRVTPYEPTSVAPAARIRPTSAQGNVLGFAWSNTVAGDVPSVPIVPFEDQRPALI